MLYSINSMKHNSAEATREEEAEEEQKEAGY